MSDSRRRYVRCVSHAYDIHAHPLSKEGASRVYEKLLTIRERRERNIHTNVGDTCVYERECLLHQIGAGFRALTILRRVAARRADRADDLAVHHEWNAAFNRKRAFESERAKTLAPDATMS